MYIGSDGITICDDVCDPDNHMPWSCHEHCKDFVFATSTQRSTTASDGQHWWIALILFAVILVATVIICLRKKIRGSFTKWRGRGHQPPTTEAVMEGVNETNVEKIVIENENASDSGISNDDSAYIDIDEKFDDKVIGKKENGGNVTEDTKLLLPCSNKDQKNVAQENAKNSLNTPVIAIGQNPATKYVVTTT